MSSEGTVPVDDVIGMVLACRFKRPTAEFMYPNTRASLVTLKPWKATP
jgi:hypothetical protein